MVRAGGGDVVVSGDAGMLVGGVGASASRLLKHGHGKQRRAEADCALSEWVSMAGRHGGGGLEDVEKRGSGMSLG